MSAGRDLGFLVLERTFMARRGGTREVAFAGANSLAVGPATRITLAEGTRPVGGIGVVGASAA